MTTPIGLISDVHATPEPVREALEIFARRGVEIVLCAGDIAGYNEALRETVDLLVLGRCRAVLGNHDAAYLDAHSKTRDATVTAYLETLPLTRSLTVDGRRIYLVHGAPPSSCREGIRLLDKNGLPARDAHEEWAGRLARFAADVLVVGHTHQVFARDIGGTLVVNPGSTLFNHSCAVLTLPQRDVEFIALSGQPIEPVWNWGMIAAHGRAG